MAKFYTGKDGVLRMTNSATPDSRANTDRLKIVSWSLQTELDTLETTTLGDTDRTYTTGVRSFGGSATLLYYEDDDGVNDAANALRQLVRSNAPSDSPFQFTLRLKHGATNKDVVFNAFITNASYGANVGEVVNVQIDFRGTGSFTTVTI